MLESMCNVSKPSHPVSRQTNYDLILLIFPPRFMYILELHIILYNVVAVMTMVSAMQSGIFSFACAADY